MSKQLPPRDERFKKVEALIGEPCDYENHPENAAKLDRFIKHLPDLKLYDGEIPMHALEECVSRLYRRWAVCEHVIIPWHDTAHLRPKQPYAYRTHLTAIYDRGQTAGLWTIDAHTLDELYRKLVAGLIIDAKSGRVDRWEDQRG